MATQPFDDISRWSRPMTPICIHYDNQYVIGRAQSSSTIVSLDIFVVDTTSLDNYSQLELSL